MCYILAECPQVPHPSHNTDTRLGQVQFIYIILPTFHKKSQVLLPTRRWRVGFRVNFLDVLNVLDHSWTKKKFQVSLYIYKTLLLVRATPPKLLAEFSLNLAELYCFI